MSGDLKKLADKLRREGNPMSLENFNETYGYTGEEIKFKDYLTGEDKVYHVHKNDEFAEEKCPIDGSQLVCFETPGSSGYMCINCENVFYDLGPEGLKARYDEILKINEFRLAELDKKRNKLERIIKRLKK